MKREQYRKAIFSTKENENSGRGDSGEKYYLKMPHVGKINLI